MGGLPELGAFMPHLICQRCGLASYSAAVYGAPDACPRCDRPLTGVEHRGKAGARRWNLPDLAAANQTDSGHTVERRAL
jgi:hypothetical protein